MSEADRIQREQMLKQAMMQQVMMDAPSGPQGTPMSPLPQDVRGPMPVSPDTRELQAADYNMRVMNELNRLNAARDVEGGFKLPAFQTSDPKLTGI